MHVLVSSEKMKCLLYTKHVDACGYKGSVMNLLLLDDTIAI